MKYAPALSTLTQTEEVLSLEQPSCIADWRAVGLAFAQPALSQQIRRLEAQLGSALFIRDARKVELTAAGTAFLAHARASLAAAIDAQAAVASIERAASGRLPLSMNGNGLDYAREFLQAFTAAHPNVHLDVTLKFHDASLKALAGHTDDASILWSGDGPPRGFADTSALVTAPGAGIALRATHPLALQPEVPLDVLDGQRLIMFARERASDVYDQVLDGLGGAGHFSSIHQVTTIGEGVGSAMLGALDDESVAPSPQWSSLRQSPTGFVHKSVVPALPASLWLVWTGTATGRARWLPSRAK